MVVVRFLGSGSGVLAGGRSQSMILIEGPGGHLLIDAGQPLQKRLFEEGVDPLKIRDIVITHAHADHVMGLPGLLFELDAMGVRESPVIWVGASHHTRIRGMLESFKPSRMKLNLNVFDDKTVNMLDTGVFRVETFPVRHSMPTVGVRVVGGEGDCLLFYSSDTVFVKELADKADCRVGVHEATLPDSMKGEGELRGFHSTPSEALEVLKKADIRVLYHISIASFKDGYPRGNYIIAYDGLTITV